MAQFLSLVDAASAKDLLTFAGRAARVGADGVRLAARNGVMTVQTATLSAQGLLDATPTVLAMRVMAVDPELVCDFVVSPDALSAGAKPEDIALPESALSLPWAGIAPPATGWEYVGEVSPLVMRRLATDGIADVADLVPADSGEDVVRKVRAAVWGPMSDELFDAPRGVAFTADALGFLRDDDPIHVFRVERWTRFSMSRGHVLSRGPARVGLTPVRTTGSATASAASGSLG